MSFSKIIFALFFICASTHIYGQESYLDYNESIELANQENKVVLMVFSGSDWCKPCIQLKKTILDTHQFREFAEGNLVILELDFPYKKKNKLSKERQKHNEELADKYNKDGSFPKVVLLDNEQNVVGQVGYEKNLKVEQFISLIQDSLE